MKIIPLLIISFLLSSCFQNSNKAESKISANDLDKIESSHETFSLFAGDQEKIALLSLSKNIPPEQVLTILEDYYEKYHLRYIENKSPEYLIKVIDTIAHANNLSSQKTASLIFAFQYEQITRDEIIENYNEEKEDYMSDRE